MKRVASRASMILAAGLMVLPIAQTSLAQENNNLHPLLTEKYVVDVGIFFPDRDVGISLDGTITGVNREFDFDSGFNLGNSTNIFAAELNWRFGEKWSLLAQYFDSSDSGNAVLAEDVEWGEFVFGAGTGARGGFDIEIIRLFAGRKFEMPDRHDLGFGGGIHLLDMGAFIEGTAIVNGMPSDARRSVSESAPLPNIGAWYRYSISPRWAFRSRLDLLSASVGDVDGLLLNALVGFDYRIFDSGSIGVAYSYFELDVDVQSNRWRGAFESIFGGPYLYLTGYF